MVKMLNFVMHILLQLKNWKKQQISKKNDTYYGQKHK